MVADLVEPEGRSNAYALLRIGNNLGIAIGPNLPVLAVGTLFYGLGVGSVALGRGFVAFLISMIVTTLGELIPVPTGTALAADLSRPVHGRLRVELVPGFWRRSGDWGLAQR